MAEVEAHAFMSDENLKQAIEEVEDALASLKDFEARRDPDDSEVEAHAFMSDESLKQAIERLEGALVRLRDLQTVAKGS